MNNWGLEKITGPISAGFMAIPSKVPAIVSIAAIQYVGTMVNDGLALPATMAGRTGRALVDSATTVAVLAAYDAGKGM
jgi:hypothetical protein